MEYREQHWRQNNVFGTYASMMRQAPTALDAEKYNYNLLIYSSQSNTTVCFDL